MMPMPQTTEPAFNNELANALRGKHPRWREGNRIGSEQTAVFLDHLRLQPDIVVHHPGGAAVVVETEFEPARTVEDDARARLGLVIAETGDVVEQAIAIRVPLAMRGDQSHLPEQIAAAEFRYCVFTHREGEPDDPLRWPESGWLSGGIDDLAGLVEQVALSERRIAEGMRILEEGVGQAAAILRSNLEDDRPGVLEQIAEALHQEDGEQTSRMAMAIVANALTVHTAIAGAYEIRTLDELRGARGRLLKSKVLETWRYILREINYWPIFKIASDVLLPIPNGTAQAVLDRLHGVAGELDGIGATSTQDLAGQMFGRLIAEPEVPRDVLHAALLGGPARRVGGVEAGRGLVRRRGGEGAAHRRSCVRDRRAALRRLPRGRGAPPPQRRRRRSAAPPDDGARADRRGHHARRDAPHRLDAVERAPDRDVRQHAGLHDALRQAGQGCRRRNRNRIA